MLGYYNAPEATAEVVQDGWFNTGDLGYLDQYGRLVIAGREKDLIIHHGIKIYPQEVEGLLLQHPHVLMAAVVGAKSGKTEIPVAFIVPHGADENLEQELKRQCQRQLARYKIPQRFYLRKQLPQTATGKIDKKALRAELAQEATSQ
jgi:long-chain acyl-CoA synthetase